MKSTRPALALISLALWCAGAALAQPLQEREDPLSPEVEAKEKKALDATFNADELSGSAYVEAGQKSIYVKFVSNSKRAVLVDGDSATLANVRADENSLHGYKRESENPLISRNQVIKPPAKVNVPSDLLYVGGSLATIGAGPVAKDYLDRKHADAGLYYGADQQRREFAGMRFGKRLIFPGESSAGRLYFKHTPKPGSRISFKILSHPDGITIGEVVLPLESSAGKPSAVPPAKTSNGLK